MVLEIALITWVEGGEGWRRGRGGFFYTELWALRMSPH